MNLKYLAVGLMLISTPALAESSSQSGSYSGSQSGVNIMNKSGKGVPSAIAPGLAASGLSCSGSAALGGSGSGWGLSLGITKTDTYCNAREDAKYIQGVTGDVGAAKERMCDTPEIAAAYARSGHPCANRNGSAQPAAYHPAQTKTFSSMKECRAYAADHAGVTCRAK